MAEFDPPQPGDDDGRDDAGDLGPGDMDGATDGAGFQFNGDNVYDDEDYDPDEAQDEVPELEADNVRSLKR